MAIVAVAVAGGWAMATVTRPVQDPSAVEMHTFVSVRLGEVGASMSLTAVTSWEPTIGGINQAAGTVTDVSTGAGGEVSAGDELYSVNLRPAIVAQGSVPAFRALARDMEGADVAQLQGLLATLGHYDGDVDGIARRETDRAIRAWQKDTGVPVSGTVELGDLVFVPALPARVSLDEDVVGPGKVVVGGEPVVMVLPDAPETVIPVTVTQSGMIAAGADVSVTGPNGEIWAGEVADRHRDPENNTVIVEVTGTAGASLCGAECASIPVVGETSLESVITTAETVSGLILPAAALVTDAEGVVSVITEDGRRVAVAIVASANGVAVVEGVASGLRVRVPPTNETGAP
ncbi:MAG TPA: peptidoglycan-binding domain-containing protein [Plantibacter sp.]|uniref:peptidoglycan-binding domain-containing protein n=1 Tax=unclassified Plantibacter TaxID=2624265 RepID=UPI002CB8B412|nr:peptidoglycan-binding domain-containing protein [Plantibacter sp.]